MDLLLVALIGGIMYLVGAAIGYRQGVADGKVLERVSRRIDEITETVRL